MTVKELIEKLQQLDENLQVYCGGDEGGYTSVQEVSDPEEFILNVNTQWYYGEHENASGYNGDKDGKSLGLAVIIS